MMSNFDQFGAGIPTRHAREKRFLAQSFPKMIG